MFRILLAQEMQDLKAKKMSNFNKRCNCAMAVKGKPKLVSKKKRKKDETSRKSRRFKRVRINNYSKTNERAKNPGE